MTDVTGDGGGNGHVADERRRVDRAISRRATLSSLGLAAVSATAGCRGLRPADDGDGGAPSGDDSGGVAATLDITEESPSTSGDVPSDADEVVFFVHGWLGASAVEGQAATLAGALSGNDYDHPVVAVRWDAGNLNFSAAQRDADTAGERLADWFADYRDDAPGTAVRTIDHSLGGRVIMSTLEAIDGAFAIDTVAPIGAAVESHEVCPDGRFYEAIGESAGEVYNYHSERDGTVCNLFSERGSGLGCIGASCGGAPANYSDVDVTDQVGGHTDYTDPEDGCVDRIAADFSDL